MSTARKYLPMRLSVEQLPDAPIFITVGPPPGDFTGTLLDSLPEIRRFNDLLIEPIYMIIDMSGVTLDVPGHMLAATVAAGGPGAMLHHPNVLEYVFISTDPVMQVALKKLREPSFGAARVSVFATRVEAVDYCYDQLGLPRPNRWSPPRQP